jgi:3-oxoacyl-[acyl-carrier-protein] synthase II
LTKYASEIKFSDRDYSGKSGFMYDNLFDTSECGDKKEVRRLDKFILYGIHSSIQAVKDANIEDGVDKSRVGVMIGSGIGGIAGIDENAITLNNDGARKISPFFIPSVLVNMVSGHVSMKYGFRGPNFAIVSACATATHSIGEAARMIACDDADIMIAGGSEASITQLGIAGFNAARALSTAFAENPSQSSRPWDNARDGFVMGEGAGVIVLEEYEHAKKRGAKIYCELVGYGASADAYHITAPHPEGEGALLAMSTALRKARISADKIDYINAHGTSTPVGDLAEVKSVSKLVGDHKSKVSMSSTKSATGHLLGAAGGIEAIFSILAIRDQICPPTINSTDLSEGCDFDFCLGSAKKRQINYALSNSFGFGGCNGSLLFGKI